MLKEEKQILDENEFLNIRKKEKIISKFEKSKTIFFILSIFLSLIIIGLIYFCSSKSNIFHITVEGNIYLKDEDIIELSGLSTNNKFLLVLPSKIEKRIKNNQLIDTCKVELKDKNLIKITIKEKKLIGYAYEDNQNVLIMADDTRLTLDKDNMYLIENVPLIEGFLKEGITLIIKQLEEVDYKMINEISEIHYYPLLKYQDHELIMRDGNYIFTSVYGLKIINKYYDIESTVSSAEHKCYYFEDISGNAYISACPWISTDEEE